MFAVMEEPENYGRLSDEKLLLKIAKGDQERFASYIRIRIKPCTALFCLL